MLFVDRSFQSLQHVALAFGGKPLLWAFKLFTFGGFTDNGLENYNSIKTFKIMSADPNDKIVKDSASIKSGLALLK
jgi:hypothetical protein